MGYKIIDCFDEIPHEAKVLIYGASKAGKILFVDLKRSRPDIQVEFFVDSYKSSGSLYSVPIVNVNNVKNKCEHIYIIASMFYEEISQSLNDIGVEHPYVYKEPERFVEVYSKLSDAVIMDRINFVSVFSPKMIHELSCIWNISDKISLESVLNEFVGVDSRYDDIGIVSDINNFAFSDDLRRYVEFQGKDVGVVDVDGECCHLIDILLFLTSEMKQNVSVYKFPGRIKNVSMIKDIKLLFIAINKNATTSTVHILNNVFQKYRKEGGPVKAPDYVDITNSKFNDYKKFTVVRNPYDRLASVFAQLKRLPDNVWLNPLFNKLIVPFSFSNFCRFVADCPDIFADAHFKSQTSFLTTPEGLMEDVTLLRMENYAEDIISFFASLGEDIEVSHNNKSRPDKVDYIKDYYTPELIKLVNERYEDDFINFGYGFL